MVRYSKLCAESGVQILDGWGKEMGLDQANFYFFFIESAVSAHSSSTDQVQCETSGSLEARYFVAIASTWAKILQRRFVWTI